MVNEEIDGFRMGFFVCVATGIGLTGSLMLSMHSVMRIKIVVLRILKIPSWLNGNELT